MSSVEAEGAVGANIGHSRGCITILMESSQQRGKIKQKDSIFDNILGSCGYKHIYKCGSALTRQFQDFTVLKLTKTGTSICAKTNMSKAQYVSMSLGSSGQDHHIEILLSPGHRNGAQAGTTCGQLSSNW